MNDTERHDLLEKYMKSKPNNNGLGNLSHYGAILKHVNELKARRAAGQDLTPADANWLQSVRRHVHKGAAAVGDLVVDRVDAPEVPATAVKPRAKRRAIAAKKKWSH